VEGRRGGETGGKGFIHIPGYATAPTSTFNFKQISGGYTPGPPLKGGGRGTGGEEGARDGRPPIHILVSSLTDVKMFLKSATTTVNVSELRN